MNSKCLFCNSETNEFDEKSDPIKYSCKCCGPICLGIDAFEEFEGERFSEENKNSISITLRNEWERNGRKTRQKEITLDDLRNIVSQFKPLNPIEKMDHALFMFDKLSNYIGSEIKIDLNSDYTLFYCINSVELKTILILLIEDGLIHHTEVAIINNSRFSIRGKGYRRIREIQKPNKDSRQCFVAMWFSGEMKKAYKYAIKPAIEFIEKGEKKPRYEAVRIDNVEHINDINDEIIAQIRRSRFVVCDLTGYRGGVYFEAGFAYGLGLEVIYTCRKDWLKDEILIDKSKNEISSLFDKNGKEISIVKQGVHFDLAHRNRIEWEPDKLKEFKSKLENRIKALIF